MWPALISMILGLVQSGVQRQEQRRGAALQKLMGDQPAITGLQRQPYQPQANNLTRLFELAQGEDSDLVDRLLARFRNVGATWEG